MESALIKGDRLLVNKISYGIRLPITLLSIPFTFDSFLGFKSYSDLFQFDYHRLFKSNINTNDVVLFNNPIETQKPIDKRSLCLSRCIALPGDTLNIERDDLYINGEKYVPSPDMLLTFKYTKENENSIVSVMNLFDIPFRPVLSDSIYKCVSLNRYEAFIINQRLPEDYLQDVNDEFSGNSYKFVIPEKGRSIKLTPFNKLLYSNAILQENPGSISYENHALIKDGISLEEYQFNEDYYWFISDNPEEASDSRQFGFISEKFIVGKASFIWFSSSDGTINRDRCFSGVK